MKKATLTFTVLLLALAGLRPDVALAQDLKFVSQVLPENMEAGRTYTVTIQYKNVNRSSLLLSSYQLGSRHPTSRRTWGVSRVEPVGKARVKPGDILTFRFDVTAPSRPGTYDFQWQLRSNGGWIGEPTPLNHIKVGPASEKAMKSEFVYQKVPGMKKLGEYYTILDQGQPYPITIMYKNTGSVAWRAGRFSLRPRKPANALTWSVEVVDLNPEETIKPGEFKAFTFNVLTPLEPGIYPFQWQMFEEGRKRWFGEPSEKVAVTVR